MLAFADGTLVWSAALVVVAAIVGGYLLAFRRRERASRERLAEAERLGIAKPTGRYPFIDASVCIGCGGCVAACPEGDVLGLVGGLAVVINGARCVGIGQCAKACPVGAIELAMGDLKSRADVPLLDDKRETTVPGVYVAGELGGLALVRNALEQGRDVVRDIARDLRGDRGAPTADAIDLAIVGAGPAGLAAALTAVEEGLSCEVLEQQADLGGTIYHYPRRKLTHTQPVEIPFHGPLERPEYSKEELLEIFSGLVARHEIRVRFGAKVTAVESVGESFVITTTNGPARARRVLLALGRRGTPRKLGVVGEELEKVMYQVRDAEQYRGAKILCVGGGDSAIEAALGLARQAGNRVTLSYRGEGFHRIKKRNQEQLERLLGRGRIHAHLGSQVLAIGRQSVRLKTREGEIELPNDFVFVLIGGEPPFDLLRRVGIEFGGADPVRKAS